MMPPRVDMQWSVKIPLSDGIELSATLYRPHDSAKPAPCIFAITPYTAQRNHQRARYFAEHGYPFLVVDCRGRGNSGGTFRPFIQEARDGFDITEWIAAQPFCNGHVAMFSGSYEGYAQWATAKQFPPHLVTIVPGMAAAPGIDFPMRNNITYPYLMQWLTFTSGLTSQDRIFEDQPFWRQKFRQLYESGRPFRELDELIGNPSAIFQEWLSHPSLDAYWDAFRPTAADFAKLNLPVLTLTGSYDGDQLGALYYYRQHSCSAPAGAFNKHYLVIGPWDHAGTLAPKAEFGGLKFGPAALLDVLRLHVEWYDWTMRGGPKPAFLKKNVAYYLMGAEEWRYADTLDAVTDRSEPFYLHSERNPIDVFKSGCLAADVPLSAGVDYYFFDPRDTRVAALDSEIDSESRVDQRRVYSPSGDALIYHSAPLPQALEVSGFFKLRTWLSIDQPDTDIGVWVYEVTLEGTAILLSTDSMRARYRESLAKETLICSTEPQCFEFTRFTFVARQIAPGSRLRLVVGALHSIYSQKNYNNGGVVSDESVKNARRVTVKLFHDSSRPSALYVPIGTSELQKLE